MNSNFANRQKNLSNDDLEYQIIIRKVDDLNSKNQNLLSIANNMINTSFVQSSHQIPVVILQFEEDMRASFNALIESIREYFIEIDQKLKHIGKALEIKISDRLTTSAKNDTASNKLEGLVVRIGLLEENLKKTQQNQGKLINIIEEMMMKQQSEMEQPTMYKINRSHQQLIKSQHEENNFRLFSMKDDSQQTLYPRPYSIIQSQVSQPSLKHNSTFCQHVNSRDHTSVKPILMPKRSLKGQNQFQGENTNKIHRMSYLMKALKD